MKTTDAAPDTASTAKKDAQRRALHAAAHLAGYSALIGYIWRQRRTTHAA